MVILPLIASLLAAGCCVVVARDYIARPRAAGAVWTIAFAIFAIAASAEVVGTLAGWTPLLARVYYVLGATLVVGYLALGELYLLLSREKADRVAGVMVVATALAIALISQAPVDPDVAQNGWHALQRGPGLTILTIGINVGGTAILVGGLAYSSVTFMRRGIMRNRMIGCLLIMSGALTVAMGGTLTRLGSHQYLYIAMSAGIALIFTGYLRSRQPDPRPAPVARPVTDRHDELSQPVSG
jgi:hypothetical protein